MKKFTIPFLGLCFILIFSCKKSTCSDAVKAKFLDATGTDGCGMLIELKNGDRIEPKNLGDFDIVPKNGKKIWVSYHTAENAFTICMMGDVVNIDCISER